MASRLQRLDPERRRKRLALLAELAGAKTLDRVAPRDRVSPGRIPVDRLRALIATRRRLTAEAR